MSYLKRVEKGIKDKPYLMIVYGVSGVGKSKFGAGAPKPIFLATEQGVDHLEVDRVTGLKTWPEVLGFLNELKTEKHDYKTLVVDSLDWLEPIIHNQVCAMDGSKSINLAAGGFGKGYQVALQLFRIFSDKLNELRDQRGMNIVLIAHAQISTFTDPHAQNAQYQRYEIKLHKSASEYFKEYVDCVLFANTEVQISQDGKTMGEGLSVAYSERRPGFDAKNRYNLPFNFPFDFKSFEENCGSTLIKKIQDLKSKVDDETKAKVDESLKGANAEKLNQIFLKLQRRVNEG